VKPSRDEISGQLERLLASEAFANTERGSRFLRYVVERTLAGEGDRLKEFVIGVDVFDRGDQYDPRIDSIVRVEAGRLRSKLDQYYSRATDEDRVVIQIPRGSYVPTFERRALHSESAVLRPSDAVRTPPRGRRWPRFGEAGAAWPIRGAVTGGLAMLALAGALTWSLRSPSKSQAPSPEFPTALPADPVPGSPGAAPQGVPGSGPPVADARPTSSQLRASGRQSHSADAGPRTADPAPRAPSLDARAPSMVAVVVLPFEHFSSDRETQLLAARFTDGVTGELARIDHISVVSRTSALQLSSEGRTLRDIARTLDAQVVVEGSLVVEGTRVDADVRLVDTVVDRKSWSRTFTADVSDLRALQQRVAADIAAFIVPRSR
jgi:TolB-like protein